MYKNTEENILEVLNILLSKCNNLNKSNKILELFNKYDYIENVYRCYTSDNEQFNKLNFNSVHIRILRPIKKVLPLIKNLYLIINQNKTNYNNFLNILDNNLYVNFISITCKKDKISFGMYYYK